LPRDEQVALLRDRRNALRDRVRVRLARGRRAAAHRHEADQVVARKAGADEVGLLEFRQRGRQQPAVPAAQDGPLVVGEQVAAHRALVLEFHTHDRRDEPAAAAGLDAGRRIAPSLAPALQLVETTVAGGNLAGLLVEQDGHRVAVLVHGLAHERLVVLLGIAAHHAAPQPAQLLVLDPVSALRLGLGHAPRVPQI
jgi:hypothetical protein